MAKSPNWTNEELTILKEAYPRLGSCKELAALFPNRTLDAITLKATRMGFRVINNIRKGRTNEEYLDLLEKTNFVALEEYKGSTVPIMHMCGICEYEWKTRPQHVLKPNARCPICDEKWIKDTSYEKVQEVLLNANMEQLSPYLGALHKITLKHKTCGYTWNTVYSYIQQGSGCPICNIGYGQGYSKYNMPETANIYLFKIITSTDIFYKIGVTTRPVHKREQEIKLAVPSILSIELIHESSDSGRNILLKEKRVLMSFKGHTSEVSFPGHTELLSITADVSLVKGIMDEAIQ